MRKIYTVGEAIFDIIFKNAKPIDAKVGGAMVNTAISLGRVGLPISYIGDTADDVVGEVMSDFLNENNVNTDCFVRYPDSKSRLALAFIDEANAPKYSFYKINTKCKIHLDFPKINKDDIILFGSFYGIKKQVRKQLIDFLHEAKKQDAIIIYDPNFRINHKPLLEEVLPYIEENISVSDIIKASNEDFEHIYGFRSFEEVAKYLRKDKNPNLIYTKNVEGVEFEVNGEKHCLEVEKLNPVSAIGAGDAFNAGIIYYIFKNNITKKDLQNLSVNQWFDMLKIADLFASKVCMSTDNYVSKDFLKS